MPRTLPHAASPFAGRTRRRWVRWLLGAMLPAALLVILAHGLDLPFFRALSVSKAELDRLEEQDLYWLVRSLGSLWPWLLIGTALHLHDRAPLPSGPRPALGARKEPWARSLCVMLSAALGGLAAEVLKLIIGRERPARLIEGEFVEQIYTFKPPLGAFIDSSNLGMPSSHAATAFAGAVALALFMPTIRPLILLLAGMSGLTRIIASAHTLSDVVVGAGLGCAIALLVCRPTLSRLGQHRVPPWAFGERL